MGKKIAIVFAILIGLVLFCVAAYYTMINMSDVPLYISPHGNGRKITVTSSGRWADGTITVSITDKLTGEELWKATPAGSDPDYWSFYVRLGENPPNASADTELQVLVPADIEPFHLEAGRKYTISFWRREENGDRTYGYLTDIRLREVKR